MPIARPAAEIDPVCPTNSIHCSIIGTCLTTGELRRVMAKVVREGVTGVSDHDLHSQAVGLCTQHSQAAKLVHKALDQRHELVIKRFAKISGEAAGRARSSACGTCSTTLVACC